jgi:ketosteroid isomerase-like protein
VLGPSDLAAIEGLERRWLACELADRPCDVLQLCSDDVVWLPPGRPPIRGTAAIRAWLETSRDRVEDIRVSDRVVDGDGLAAYKIANFCTRYTPWGSPEAVTITGWHFWVLRRGPGLEWRVAAVAWSVVQP